MAKIGYARVSSLNQDLEGQLASKAVQSSGLKKYPALVVKDGPSLPPSFSFFELGTSLS